MKTKRLKFYEPEDFFAYKEAKKEDGFEIISISKIISKFSKNENIIDEILNDKLIVDLSVLIEYQNYQALGEQIISQFKPYTEFICEVSIKTEFQHKLRFIFDDFIFINTALIKGSHKKSNTQDGREKKSARRHIKITDFTEEELSQFFKDFNSRLYGHPKFKKDLREQVESFRMFNKLKEHKVLSLFLLGDSGVGKTEVARAFYDSMGGKTKLAKINFGNYSNEFSLSSLIGAARGYRDSEDGEIFMKVRETDVGVLLIDEFEKSNATLFNYFLEVLESGKMTGSLGQEMDINGFIIVFTSNIKKEEFTQRISPELRSRFDYKGRFLLLKNDDKKKYVEFRSDDIAQKVKVEFEDDIKNELKEFLRKEINVSSFDNMRDINKQIKKKFLRFYSGFKSVAKKADKKKDDESIWRKVGLR